MRSGEASPKLAAIQASGGGSVRLQFPCSVLNSEFVVDSVRFDRTPNRNVEQGNRTLKVNTNGEPRSQKSEQVHTRLR
jgi:hypothetical protein